MDGLSFETKPAENVTFDINGTKFEAYGTLPGVLALEAGEMLRVEQVAGRDLLGWFAKIMPEDEWKKFEAFIYDPPNAVTLDVLREIFWSLVKAYSKFPTQPPSDSSAGREPTAQTSKAD